MNLAGPRLKLARAEEHFVELENQIVDALIAWGGIDAIKRRIDDHFAAGADHVCIQEFSAAGFGPPVEEWRALAPALLA